MIDATQHTVFDITVKTADGSSFTFNVRARDLDEAKGKLRDYLEEMQEQLEA